MRAANPGLETPEEAADLGSIERAVELSRDEHFVEVEILVFYGDLVRGELVVSDKPRSAGSQPPTT
jgi:hypothetical protein